MLSLSKTWLSEVKYFGRVFVCHHKSAVCRFNCWKINVIILKHIKWWKWKIWSYFRFFFMAIVTHKENKRQPKKRNTIQFSNKSSATEKWQWMRLFLIKIQIGVIDGIGFVENQWHEMVLTWATETIKWVEGRMVLVADDFRRIFIRKDGVGTFSGKIRERTLCRLLLWICCVYFHMGSKYDRRVMYFIKFLFTMHLCGTT